MHGGLSYGTFAAQAFLGKGPEQKKISGEITLSPMGLRFVAKEEDVTLPLQGMNVSWGGAAGKLLFFSHSQYQEWRIFTRDKSILQEPTLQRQPQVQELLSQGRRRLFWGALILGSCLFALVFAGMLIFQAKDSFVATLAAQIPAEWEQKLGETVYEQMRVKHRFIEDPELKSELEVIVRPLLETIDSKRYNFQFYIVDEGSLNAFAIPGGYIFIHSGLLLQADRVEEVLGVVAHELAHITKMHGLRKLIETAGVMIVAQALLGDIGGLLGVLANNAPLLLNQKFSRDLEREADEAGWEYIRESNIDPNGMLTFFEKMLAEEKKIAAQGDMAKVSEFLGFLSTHPATEERVEVLRGKIENLPGDLSYISFDLNFNAFKHNVQRKQRPEEEEQHDK